MNTIKESINSFWINVFWKNPNHLWALKVTVSIAFLLIPAEILFHNSFIGTNGCSPKRTHKIGCHSNHLVFYHKQFGGTAVAFHDIFRCIYFYRCFFHDHCGGIKFKDARSHLWNIAHIRLYNAGDK